MKKLYKFLLDCGRMGSIDGLFVADDQQEIAPAIGIEMGFDEPLGKHSSFRTPLEREHLRVMSEDPVFIAEFERIDCASGHNPLHAITCQGNCGDVLEAPYKRCERCGWER